MSVCKRLFVLSIVIIASLMQNFIASHIYVRLIYSYVLYSYKSLDRTLFYKFLVANRSMKYSRLFFFFM